MDLNCVSEDLLFQKKNGEKNPFPVISPEECLAMFIFPLPTQTILQFYESKNVGRDRGNFQGESTVKVMCLEMSGFHKGILLRKIMEK